MFVVKHLQRGVHAVAARRAGTRQGMSSHITSPYLIPALLHYDSFQLRLSTCQALNHYTDIDKSLPLANRVTQPSSPMPVK